MKICWFCLLTVPMTFFGLDLPKTTYQDVIVNDTVVAKGNGPDCATRYEAMRLVLDSLERPFTVLDIGAAEGYFSFRIAKDYGACVVMVGDPNYRENLLEKLCIVNEDLDRVILLSKKISGEELTELSKREHFDVVLALNVLHHFNEDWQEAFDAVLQLGDQVILESPPNGDSGACGQSLIEPINARINQEPYFLLGQFQRHTDASRQDRLIWIQKDLPGPRNLYGIHLDTFLLLNGCYPSREKFESTFVD